MQKDSVHETGVNSNLPCLDRAKPKNCLKIHEVDPHCAPNVTRPQVTLRQLRIGLVVGRASYEGVGTAVGLPRRPLRNFCKHENETAYCAEIRPITLNVHLIVIGALSG